nr:lantibiotic dehydratase [Streptomyces sp. SID3343]
MRATTRPADLGPVDDVDISGDGAAARGTAWLSRLWRDDRIRAGVGEASPDLSWGIEALVSGEVSGDPRRVRRAVLALGSYLLRWQGRPTPFGRFAGVAAVRIGPETKVRWGEAHRAFHRADAEWLADVVGRLLRCPELLDRLSVVANDCGRVRGDRFVAPGPPAQGSSPGLAPVEVSVRHTRPVRAALEAARSPVRYGELRALLVERFPAASREQVDRVLGGLLAQNLLISCLYAPMTSPDALGHVCGELRAANAHHLPAVRDDVHDLYAIHRRLTASPRVDPREATERMRAASAVASTPLVVDTALDCDVRIPEQVVREARDAAAALYRLTPYPFGAPQWRDYHTRFRARYGVGALVPVPELVADSGLGLPADFLGSAHGRAARQVSARDEKLLALVQQAVLDGSGEIVLTPAVIEDLAAGAPEDVLLPPRTEVAVTVLAPSPQALSRGNFRLVVTGTPRPGSSMAGRLAHLLPEEDRARLAHTYGSREAVAAQLSFTPRRRRNENVARTTQLLPHVISLAEHREPNEDLITVTDLAVTADARRLRLVRLSTGEFVEPRVPHALEAGIHTPPLARFLAELCTARCAVYQGFHFGVASALPYLPRVRFHRTVLAPARWLLTTRDLAAPDTGATTEVASPNRAWAHALDAWRARLRVPARVALIDHDRRLPVDLDRRLDRSVLRTSLERTGTVELRETPTPEDVAWLGRAHELLIPLTLDHPATPAAPRTIDRLRPVSATAGHLPGGSDIVYAQLHGHPARQDEILTDHLPALLASFDAPVRWWYRRHREMTRPDTDQYLAVYLHLPDTAGYGPAAERIRDWAQRLRRDRLLAQLAFATHEPQTGRYGHGSATDAAYHVFTTDSLAAIAQIRAADHDRQIPQALAAAGILDLAGAVTGSAEAGLAWLIRELPREQGRLDPALRDAAWELTTPDRPTAHPTPSSPCAAAFQAWSARAAAVAAYRRELATQQREPATVLRSLIHLHCVRALGVDPDRERVVQRLARACALRLAAPRRQEADHRADAALH